MEVIRAVDSKASIQGPGTMNAYQFDEIIDELRRSRSRLGWILFTMWLPVILTVVGYVLLVTGIIVLGDFL